MSQGTTAEESLLVLGDVAARALGRWQFYVGNTRFRGAHAIYVASTEEILTQLSRPDGGRELATEFLQRHRLLEREELTQAARYNQTQQTRTEHHSL